jgi:SAM-dependent methyltransferase
MQRKMTQRKEVQRKKVQRKKKRVRRRPDRHELYEQAVQCPEADIRFFERVYRKHNGGELPRSFREDFCGTAALAAEWVRKRQTNTAIGIDLDGPTLEWGRRRNIEPLGEAASRLKLLQKNVLEVTRPRCDVIAAMNFSYFIFKTREALRAYFRIARRSLAPSGVFVLDIFGGSEAQAEVEEEKELDGFNYYWDQHRFDPITNETLFYIHFLLDDGRWVRKAFTYDWRLWSIPEVRELLEEAGFQNSEVYWEGTDRATGEGNGVFLPSERQGSCPGWIAYIVAWS